MTGLRVLVRKELLEQVRTMRLVVLAIVFILFGIISPLTAKYLPDLLKTLGGTGLTITVPTPTTADAVDQQLKNVSQFGILAAILLAMGSVATEKERGTAAFVLSKPVSRAAFLTAKLVAIGVDLLVAVAGAVLVGALYTAFLFEPLPIAGVIEMGVVLWLSIMVFAALTFVGSTLTRSAAGGAGVGFALLVVTGILGALPTIGPYMPASLIGPARALALGHDAGAGLGPIMVNIALVPVLGVVGWLAFRHQEL